MPQHRIPSQFAPSVLPRWPSAVAAAAGLRSPEERAVLGGHEAYMQMVYADSILNVYIYIGDVCIYICVGDICVYIYCWIY